MKHAPWIALAAAVLLAAAVAGELLACRPATPVGGRRSAVGGGSQPPPPRVAPDALPAPVFEAPESLGAGGGWLYRLKAEKVMGSGFSATAVFERREDARARAALVSALAAARALEKKISKYDPDSEVRRLSGLPPGRSLEVSPETFEALRVSVDLWRKSGGAFDCTVEPLLKLYRFAGRPERPPTEPELAAARSRAGTDKLLLDSECLQVGFRAAGMELDLGAVGQGYGADLAAEALRRGGAAAALVELGGEVRAVGPKRPGRPWEVGIQHPRAERGRLMTTVRLAGNAVSTSGDYEKFFLQGGRRASHIIDARTGRPLVGGAVSVAVIAPSCILADGLATAVSALGPREGLKLIEEYRAEGRAVEALVIEEAADGRLIPHLSPGLAGKLEVRLDLGAAGADRAP